MKRKRLKDIGPIGSFALAMLASALIFIAVAFISAIVSGFFKDSRAGAEYLTLVTLLCSGFITGFVSRKILMGSLPAVISSGTVCIIFAMLAAIIFGYSLGAFMNEATFFLLSLVGIFAARERKKHRRRR